MASFGISDIEVNNPNKAKHTETTQRFRVNLVNTAGRKLPTKVEFSRREYDLDSFELEEINPEIARGYRKLSFKALHYSGDAAVVQKVRALAGRPATQARDVFDLEILRRAGYCEIAQHGGKLDKALREQAAEAAMSISYKDYEQQVLDFLEIEVRSLYGNESEWVQMQEKVVALLMEAL